VAKAAPRPLRWGKIEAIHDAPFDSDVCNIVDPGQPAVAKTQG
jgi:hypothetical protein